MSRRGTRDHPVPHLTNDELIVLRDYVAMRPVTQLPDLDGGVDTNAWGEYYRTADAEEGLVEKRCLYRTIDGLRVNPLGRKTAEAYQNVEVEGSRA